MTSAYICAQVIECLSEDCGLYYCNSSKLVADSLMQLHRQTVQLRGDDGYQECGELGSLSSRRSMYGALLLYSYGLSLWVSDLLN